MPPGQRAVLRLPYLVSFEHCLNTATVNMAGGALLSKDAKKDPSEIFNGRLLYLLVTLAAAGMFYGFDSGNIGGIMELPSFEHSFVH